MSLKGQAKISVWLGSIDVVIVVILYVAAQYVARTIYMFDLLTSNQNGYVGLQVVKCNCLII